MLWVRSVPQRPTDLPSPPLTSPLRQAEEDRNGHCESLQNLELPDVHVTYLARSFRVHSGSETAREDLGIAAESKSRADGDGRRNEKKVRGRGTSPCKVVWKDKKNLCGVKLVAADERAM